MHRLIFFSTASLFPLSRNSIDLSIVLAFDYCGQSYGNNFSFSLASGSGHEDFSKTGPGRMLIEILILFTSPMRSLLNVCPSTCNNAVSYYGSRSHLKVLSFLSHSLFPVCSKAYKILPMRSRKCSHRGECTLTK